MVSVGCIKLTVAEVLVVVVVDTSVAVVNVVVSVVKVLVDVVKVSVDCVWVDDREAVDDTVASTVLVTALVGDGPTSLEQAEEIERGSAPFIPDGAAT